MDVPSFQTNRHFKLVLIAILIFVAINISEVNADNEQHLFYKEYERLQKQVKPVNYNWQDQISTNQQKSHRRTPNYQHPQFNANFPSRSSYGVQQQQQRQEQHHHDSQARILKVGNTKYSVWSQNLTFMSSTGYNALGMGQLYNLTNKVVEFFVDADEPIPPGYFVVSDMKVDWGQNVKKHQYYDLMRKYWLIIIVIVITVIAVLLMPLIGLCFCCCRCAGACGGRSQPFDKKHDTCRRFLLGFCLLIVASSMVFGVIVAYVTNVTLQHGVENATSSARFAVEDTRTYLKSTSYHIRHLLVNNYGELKEHLFHTLDKTSDTVLTQLDRASNTISLDQLHNIVEGLPEIQRDLTDMDEITRDMQQKASQLNDGLRGVKRELLIALQQCRSNECKQVQKDYEIGRLDENNIHYDALPDQKEIIKDIRRLLDGSLQETVNSSEQKVKEIKNEIGNIIKSNVPEVKMSINKVGQALLNISNTLTKQIESFSDVAGNHTFPHLNTADDYIASYSIHRYYGGLIISSVLLIVLMFITFGLLCGICGKRPDGYGDDCCTKGAGARFLMCGVAIIFLTISALLVICLACFLVGIVMKRGVCDPLNNPEGDQVFSYLDNFIDLNKFIFPENQRIAIRQGNGEELKPLRISQVVGACHRNESIFEVLRLDDLLDIDQIRDFPEQFGINEKLNELADNVQITSQVRILNDQARKEIRELSKSELNNFEAYKYVDNLAENITHYNLNSLADRLKAAADRISSSSNEIKTKLEVQQLHLRTYQKNLVEPLISGTNRLLILSKKLNEKLLFKQVSFEKAINMLIKEIDDAERFLNEEGTSYVQQVAHELLDSFSRDIKGYLDLVINATKSDVGRCDPISNVYDSIVVAACNRVVDPFNGFWAGVVFCVLLFFPTIVLSAKLSTLYQKSDPYPGPLVEAVPKNKRRRKTDRRHDGRDRRGEFYEEASPANAAASSSHPIRDARYVDMAPKNWDGAPPRYQQSSFAGHPSASEYERPPPYNFTGPYPVAPSETD
ncbi:CLUMA_CG021257, isoform A [Clunio marinus]|uniref:CLUMA_CG021257, isoform A n=1 Tax=Clunio marinus TaxID=568069 RepID=A0A1J1J8M8_9DIPT|nr:CLUMA_CG021257, isoform A [Clunio marinus]